MNFKSFKAFLVAFLLLAIFVMGGSFYWEIGPKRFIDSATRFCVSNVFSIVYGEDTEAVEDVYQNYYIGPWQNHTILGGSLSIKSGGDDSTINSLSDTYKSNKFIYENPSTDYLDQLRTHYNLSSLIESSKNDYEAIIELAHWVGNRWDHGTDPLPREGKYNPLKVLEQADNGSRYWCEIAAILMVQSATSLGMPARLVTLSRDGYRWEHAVAEVWSNHYNKWLVVDVDYNVMYMASGVPLSAYELCHDGLSIQQNGNLKVVHFPEKKPSLTDQDLLPFYRYVHIDLRNDWQARSLRRGSPVGGDLSTYWTARPSLKRLLTAKIRVDKKEIFNWKVNNIYVQSNQETASGAERIAYNLMTYSPYFASFQVRTGDKGWRDLVGESFQTSISSGKQCNYFRVKTKMGWTGPEEKVCN